MEVLHVDFRATWVLLAAAISFMGTHTAFAMCEQVRIARLSDKDKPRRNFSLLVLVAMSLGGVGFFGSFYTGSLSMRLRTARNSIVLLKYDPSLVIGSVFITTAVTLVGLFVASTDECFCRTKQDIMEMFIMRAGKTMTIGEIKRMGRFNILFRVCTSSLGRVLIGGIISGGALALQGYMGVLSFSIRGDVTVDQGSLAGALILCFVGVPFLYWLFFRVLSVFTEYDSVRVACAGCGLLVMCGVHFITLVGVRFHYDPEEDIPESSTPPSKIVIGVLTATVMFSFFMLMSVLADLRVWLVRASVQLSMADSALLSLLNKPMHERVKPSTSTAALSAANLSAHGAAVSTPGAGGTNTAIAGAVGAAGPLPAILSADSSLSSAEFNRSRMLPTPVIHYAARYLRRFVELSEVSMAGGSDHHLHRRRGEGGQSGPNSAMGSPRDSPIPPAEGQTRTSSGNEYARVSTTSSAVGFPGEDPNVPAPSRTGSSSGVRLKVLHSGNKIHPAPAPISGTASGSPKQPVLAQLPSRSASPSFNQPSVSTQADAAVGDSVTMPFSEV